MLWWARIGKLLQFAGGAAVVLDLVGPERLRRTGTRFLNGSRVAKALEAAARKFSSEKDIAHVRYTDGKNHRETGSLLADAVNIGAMFIGGTIALIIIVARGDLPSGPTTFDRIVSTLWIISTGSGVGLLTVVLISFLFQWFAGRMSKALSGDNPGHPLRWLAFILIIVGFHFDLLGS